MKKTIILLSFILLINLCGTTISNAQFGGSTRNGHTLISQRQSIYQKSVVDSQDGRYRLAMQEDGNLVLYKISGGNMKAIWATSTNGKAVEKCVFQSDGNLVLYGFAGNAVWATGTDGRGLYMLLQNDGNLVIYDNRNKAIWATGTFEKN